MTTNSGLILCLIGVTLTAVSCTDDTSPTEPASAAPEAATLSASATQPLSFYQISTADDFSHTCALTTTNQAYCWGTGFLGDGSAYSSRRLTPVAVTGGHQFRAISSGFSYTCALTTDNRAFCWGNNEAGQLGDGTTEDRPEPVAAAPSLRFRQIGVGLSTNVWPDHGQPGLLLGLERRRTDGDRHLQRDREQSAD